MNFGWQKSPDGYKISATIRPTSLNKPSHSASQSPSPCFAQCPTHAETGWGRTGKFKSFPKYLSVCVRPNYVNCISSVIRTGPPLCSEYNRVMCVLLAGLISHRCMTQLFADRWTRLSLQCHAGAQCVQSCGSDSLVLVVIFLLRRGIRPSFLTSRFLFVVVPPWSLTRCSFISQHYVSASFSSPRRLSLQIPLHAFPHQLLTHTHSSHELWWRYKDELIKQGGTVRRANTVSGFYSAF